MKTQTKLAVAVVILTTVVAAHAEWVSSYYRSSGTYVQPYYRTPANGIVYDNLSYRGYPSQQAGYVSSRNYGYGGCAEAYATPYSVTGISTRYGNTMFHNYQSSYGGSLSGSTLNFGNSSFTTLSGW